MTPDSSPAPVLVVGAGVLGLAVAVALGEAGRRVTVIDPDPEGWSASAVAAGLLAPAAEAAFDPPSAAHHPLLSAALAAWPGFAARTGIALAPTPTVLVGAPGAPVPALEALGVAQRPHERGVAVDDRQLADVPAALRALRTAAAALGGRIEVRALGPKDWAAPQIVLAPGPGALGLAAAVPELRHLSPVKGQIATAPRGPQAGPALRWPGGYLAPQADGARIGATMEPGRADTTVDPAVLEALARRAQAAAPDLDLTDLVGRAGVRMQSPDGLPLVGPSARPGVLVAAGARRNGWLLAPLVGAIIAAYVTGEDPGPWASALHPGRFDR